MQNMWQRMKKKKTNVERIADILIHRGHICIVEMAENDKKRYYWLKLKKDFFQSHKMKVLKALPNGRLYALIYLELLAESTSHEGALRFSDLLPYDITTLSAVIDEDRDNVEKAVEVLERLELLEILSDKTIYMLDISTMIGSETGQTIRKKLAMVKNTEALPNSYQKNTLENRDKSIEIRIDDDIQKEHMLEANIDQINNRNIEAGLYDTLRAYNLERMVKKAYSVTGVLPSLQRLNEIMLKVADGECYNEQAYIIECFKKEASVYA